MNKQAKTIAVLPFVNMSGDAAYEYLSDGMTEEIINALTKVDQLKVTSRTSSFYFKNKKLPLPEIGAALNVATILEGSIRVSGTQLRITAQLIDVADDFHFWSENFDRPIADLFAVQDEISLLIADKLRENLGHLEIEDQLVESYDIPVDLYKQYLKAKYHVLQMTKHDIELSLSIFLEIIEAQPNYPLAYLGVHQAYTMLGTIGLAPAAETFLKGKEYLDKAIAMAPDLPECQIQSAWISYLQDWDIASAYVHVNKALDSRPVVDSYQTMASILVAEGKFTAALNYLETALQLDPFSEINYHLKGFIHYAQEKFEQAIECFEKSNQLKPTFNIPNLYKGLSLMLLGRHQEALEHFLNIQEDATGDLIQLGGTTIAHIFLGNAKEAQAGLDQLNGLLTTPLMGRAVTMLTLCKAASEDDQEVLALVEQGVQYRLPLTVYLYIDPFLKPLRSDERFQNLMRQVLGPTTSFDFSKRKYKKSLFDPALLQQYKAQLEQYMQEKSPYLDPELSLRSLAQQLDLSPNQLSQLLNEGFDRNFSEFINLYRLETFKQKANDPANQQLTILALAYDSGFSSKTVFNTFFKKVEGKTPREYFKHNKL